MPTRRNLLRNAAALAVFSPLSKTLLANASAKTAPALPRISPARNPAVSLNVRDLGAMGDGKANDTTALQSAIDRVAALGGGEVLVPAGQYLTGALQLRSHVAVRLAQDAELLGSADTNDYPTMQVRWEGKWIPGHTALLYAVDAEQIAITGPGRITGSNALGGRPTKDLPLRHPALIEFLRCREITLDGFSTSYHLMWSIHPAVCEDVSIRNLTIRSTGGNGDGIDVDSCKRVLIDACDIATGDDCISLKSGRGNEGFTLNLPTEDVTITNCTFADSIFACIGIGSETSAGIRHVLIERCKFTAAKTYGLYIKSRPGRGPFLEDLTARDLEVSGMTGGFLRLNLLNSGLQDQDPVPGAVGIPTAKNIRIENVKVTDVPVLVDASAVHPDKPVDGFTLANIAGTAAQGIALANMRNVTLRDIHVTTSGPLLRTYNVQGIGLADAKPLDAPKLPAEVPAPAEPYKLH